ncbi:MAG: site-2 protease family protein [archaeon]|nr:site-2 protease family protein [archaeon]
MDREKRDLIISWATITLAFSMVLSENALDLFSFFEVLPIAALGVGSGFILHELAHKYVSIHYGAHAEFRAWDKGLMLVIVSAILVAFGWFPFLFAAPGAVYIMEHVSRKQNGIISLAGPLTNIVIGVAFIFLGVVFPLFSKLFFPVAWINFSLGLFNLIPIPPLDGSKVLAWNGLVWAVFFIPLALFIFLPGFFRF